MDPAQKEIIPIYQRPGNARRSPVDAPNATFVEREENDCVPAGTVNKLFGDIGW
jgi:hypothetical protein